MRITLRTACVLMLGLSATACTSGSHSADKGGEGNGAGRTANAGEHATSAGHDAAPPSAGRAAEGGGGVIGKPGEAGHGAATGGGPSAQSGNGAPQPARAHVMFQLKGVQ